MRTLRTIAGVTLIILGAIGGLIPVLQGWMFVVAGVAVLGIDHVLVKWARRRIERYKWGRTVLQKLKIPPLDSTENGTPPT